MSSHVLGRPMLASPLDGAHSAPADSRPSMTGTRGMKANDSFRSPGPAGGAVAGDVRPLDLPKTAATLAGAPPAEQGAERADASGASGDGALTPDDAVIRRVLDGATNDFEVLVRKYASRVTGAVARHIPYDHREEVVQDTWVRAYQSLDGFRPGTRFGDWLTGIAVRASYDFWRQHYRRREVPESALGDSHREWIEAAGTDQSTEEFQTLVRRKEARELLDYALAQVSPEDRLVVSLVHLEGLSAQEAAKQLGWSVVNVKVRAHRSRRRMRTALEAWLGEDEV